MKRSFAVVIFLIAAIANAKDKPQADYQDAVLVGFQTLHSGSSCSTSGQIKGKEDSSGNVTGSTDASTNCEESTVRHYTVKVGEHTYVLEPTLSWWASPAFMKNSVLANLLPGTHIQIRTDVKGFAKGFYVKVGKRESKYAVVGAE